MYVTRACANNRVIVMALLVACAATVAAFHAASYADHDSDSRTWTVPQHASYLAHAQSLGAPHGTYQYGPHVTEPARSSSLPPSPSWHVFSEVPLFHAGPRDPVGPHESGIIAVGPEIFSGAGAADSDARHRYLIFGAGAQSAPSAPETPHASLSPSSATQVPSLPPDGHAASATAGPTPGHGFFSVAAISRDHAADLASRGFVVIPDRPLELHGSPFLQPSEFYPSAADPAMADAAGTGASQGASYVESGKDIHGSNGAVSPTTHVAASTRGDPSADRNDPKNGQNRPSDSVDPTDASRIRLVAGLGSDATKLYNATGEGITIAIVDTGVDFSNPDIRHALARDPVTNHPVMLDPDGQGIVITNATFYAEIDEHGAVRNTPEGRVPDGFDSVVYVTGDGVFLDIERGGRGLSIPVYNSLYPDIGDVPVFNGTLDHDMKIGENNRDYIRSQSGAYRLGAIFQMGAQGLGPQDVSKIQVVPVLVVDSAVPGTYDTIVPDMSTSWADYARDPTEAPDYDFDFTDETPIVLGGGNEFLTYDSDGDGITDYTAGTVGARVLDVYSVINASMQAHYDEQIQVVNGTLLPGLDPDGRFFGVMTDPRGHGTASSATIVSAGTMEYDIYNDTGSQSITGVAPGAKILPVKALWLGDAVYGWLWAAGFENHGSEWTFSGDLRSDIISNSWGVTAFPAVGSAPGYDMLSLVLDMLATPRSFDDDYPGVVMVSSAGNSGHGYGTMGMPGAASFGISVGASTNNVFVGYGPFKEQPRFGSAITHHGDVVDFSSRGPGAMGDVRPDVVSMGAYGFVPRNMMGAIQDADTRDPFSMFGGTSMAAPMVAGAAAVVMSEMTENLLDYDPFVVRNILMSTARDTYNDPFVQGAGLVDAGAALDFVHGRGGVFAVSNDDSYRNIRDMLHSAISSANITDTGIGRFELPERQLPTTSWFAGHLQPGERTTATFTVENPGTRPISLEVMPYVMSLVEHTSHNGTTIVRQQDPILNETGVYAPNYVRLADVHRDYDLAGLFDDGGHAPSSGLFPDDASLMILDVRFAFEDFMNMSADVYADDISIASVYLYDWIDENGDSEVSSDELSMVTRGGSWGTVQEIRVSDPASRFEGVPMVGIYPVPQKYSYWVGLNGANATALDYVVSAGYYARADWDAVWSERADLDVGAADTAETDVTLIIPRDADAGIYHGFVAFEGEEHEVNVPVSFVVSAPVRDASSSSAVSLVRGPSSQDAGASSGPFEHGDMMYGTGYTKGAFDMVGRYMAGDWRHYHFDVMNSSISAASVDISWHSPHTSLSAFVIDPAGKIIQTNVPSGVFGHFLDWPSVDWLGTTPFSEGGGFYPVSGDPEGGANHTFMTFPINGTGTYAIMMHTTLFGAESSSTERVGISVHFYDDAADAATIASGVMDAGSAPVPGPEPAAPVGVVEAPEAPDGSGGSSDHGDVAPDLGTGDTGSAADLREPGAVPDVLATGDAPAGDSGFGTGVVVGLAAGVAIGVASFVVLRRSKAASPNPVENRAPVL